MTTDKIAEALVEGMAQVVGMKHAKAAVYGPAEVSVETEAELANYYKRLEITQQALTAHSAYEAGFYARLERLEAGGPRGLQLDAEGFSAYCPSELRESGERAAKLRKQFIKGWKEAAQ